MTSISPDRDRLDDDMVMVYDRATVDDFLRAVDAEAERLETVIREARARESRARGLLMVHESMVATMLDAYRDVTRMRWDAEIEAAAIRAAAQR